MKDSKVYFEVAKYPKKLTSLSSQDWETNQGCGRFSNWFWKIRVETIQGRKLFKGGYYGLIRTNIIGDTI